MDQKLVPLAKAAKSLGIRTNEVIRLLKKQDESFIRISAKKIYLTESTIKNLTSGQDEAPRDNSPPHSLAL